MTTIDHDTTEHEDVTTVDTEGAPQDQQDDAQQPEGTPEDAREPDGDEDGAEGNSETFSRSYVDKLRKESGKYRQRAQRADDYAHRLHTALVAATGRLADPEDLEFSEDHLGDPEALTAAVDALLARKPHLASRRPSGNIGQGPASGADTVSLGGILRAGAR